jgi:hypothetical protein
LYLRGQADGMIQRVRAMLHLFAFAEYFSVNARRSAPIRMKPASNQSVVRNQINKLVGGISHAHRS